MRVIPVSTRCQASEDQCVRLQSKCAELKRKLDDSQSALQDLADSHKQLLVSSFIFIYSLFFCYIILFQIGFNTV